MIQSSVDSSVRANLIGTDATGTSVLSNNTTGIWLNSSQRIAVGGTSAGEGNIIGGSTSGCCEAGIYLTNADDNRLLGNRVGVTATGGAIPNAPEGIYIDGSSDVNHIGDGTTGGANVVANNGGTGIAVHGRGNRIRGNSIRDNGGLGIDLQHDGVTANDAGDVDGGPNRFQNFPTVSTSASNAGGTHVTGTLASRPNRQYALDFYSSPTCDGSGNGEGSTYLGSKTVTTDGAGAVSFNANLSVSAPAASSVTATDVVLGDTSEFSPCYANQGGMPAASVADVSSGEGSGTLDFTVTLSTSPVFSPVTIDYQTAPGSATGADFDATSGTVTFTGSQTVKTVSVPITNDALDEIDETFTLTLSNPNNANIASGQGTATGTILDNDAAPGITVTNAPTATEPDTGSVNQQFSVTLSAPSSLPVTVTIATVPGTATADVDYTSNAASLTFNPGQQVKTFVVPTLGDVIDESGERYFARAFAPTNATLLDDSGQALINDNDPPPSLSISDVTAAEGNAGSTVFAFVATLSGPSGLQVSANLATADGTAVAPGDYTARTNGGAGVGIRFAPGVTTVVFNVTVKTNTVAEPDETFTLNVVSVTNATVGDGQGVGTIQNDD